MKKDFFYIISIVLFVTSLVCLGMGAVANKPDEFTAVLIAVMVLSDLFLVIVEDWSIGIFFWLLLITAVAVFSLGVLSIIVYPIVYGISDLPATFGTYMLTYGVRLASLAWPIVLLYNGVLHYEKLNKKEEPEAK
jgi:hypothetical protein